MRTKQSMLISVILLLQATLAASEHEPPLTIAIIKNELKEQVRMRNRDGVLEWYVVLQTAYLMDYSCLTDNQKTAWKFFERRFDLEMRIHELSQDSWTLIAQHDRSSAYAFLKQHIQKGTYHINWTELLGPGLTTQSASSLK